MIKTGLMVFLLIVMVAALSGCGSKGAQCDGCSHDENICQDGLYCAWFADGIKRCVENEGDECRSFGKNSILAP
jgi:hypothetical protein